MSQQAPFTLADDTHRASRTHEGWEFLYSCKPARTWLDVIAGRTRAYDRCLAHVAVPEGAEIERDSPRPRAVYVDRLTVKSITLGYNDEACVSGMTYLPDAYTHTVGLSYVAPKTAPRWIKHRGFEVFASERDAHESMMAIMDCNDAANGWKNVSYGRAQETVTWAWRPHMLRKLADAISSYSHVGAPSA